MSAYYKYPPPSPQAHMVPHIELIYINDQVSNSVIWYKRLVLN